MTYLGIDVDRVGSLSEQFRVAATIADEAQGHLVQAELLADEPVSCGPALDEIERDLNHMADQIDWAVEQVRSFRLSVTQVFDWPDRPAPIRTPVPDSSPTLAPPTLAPSTQPSEAAPVVPVVPPQWDANLERPWQQVHQVSSHNSYEVPGGVQVLFDQGVRSFELDVHRRAPLDPLALVAPGLLGRLDPSPVAVGDPDSPRWHVYHATGVSFREYDGLREGLAAVSALDTSDPLTVFIDIKDGFKDAHTFDAFDQVLVEQLGSRLYTPQAFQSRGDGASLLDTAQSQGWPDVGALQGRVIVVLTDEIGGYSRPTAQAFVAPPPRFEEAVSGAVQHVPEPDAIFYNANNHRVGPLEIAAVHATGTMVRTYFNPRCDTIFFGEESSAAHYRAVDVGVNDPLCHTRVLVPPIPVPAPSG